MTLRIERRKRRRLTLTESAERQSVAPGSGTLGRVGSDEELVVDVEFEAVDHQRRTGRVLGRHVIAHRLRPRPAGHRCSVPVTYLRVSHTVVRRDTNVHRTLN